MTPANKGKFIVFEGLDGSGKSTQTKLLISYLKRKGYKTAKIDFPQYGKKSAGLVEEYLNGKYGQAEEVGPYVASIFYACDRYDASFKLREWLKQGKIVVSDRYIASNIGHQGGKIKSKKARLKYIRWLYELEYGLFQIPKPDATLILKTSSDFSLKLAHIITDEEKKRKREIYLGQKKKDIHDGNKSHLDKALESYLQAAKEFPEDFKIVECIEKGRLLSPEEIHQKIVQLLKQTLES